MYEFQSNNKSKLDHWEKVCKDRWAFIVGHTRKDDKIRVLANRSDFGDLVRQGLKGLNQTEYKKYNSVTVNFIPEEEWLEKESCPQ